MKRAIFFPFFFNKKMLASSARRALKNETFYSSCWRRARQLRRRKVPSRSVDSIGCLSTWFFPTSLGARTLLLPPSIATKRESIRSSREGLRREREKKNVEINQEIKKKKENRKKRETDGTRLCSGGGG